MGGMCRMVFLMRCPHGNRIPPKYVESRWRVRAVRAWAGVHVYGVRMYARVCAECGFARGLGMRLVCDP